MLLNCSDKNALHVRSQPRLKRRETSSRAVGGADEANTLPPNELRLQPGEQRKISFQGRWVLRLVSGNIADLRVLGASTAGGELTDDCLKMCEN
jgi:hypothetical protein